MTVKRTNANFRLRNDVLDQITPKNVVQPDIRAPHGPWRPAAWLPVVFTKTNIQVGEDAFVCSSGKVVAMDTESYLVPAGQKLLLKAGAGALVYTARDVEWGVTDLVTGAEVAAPVSYTSIEVAEALIERGLVLEQDAVDAGGTVPPTLQAHADVIIDIFISPPVGYAGYDFYVWSGLPEEGNQHYTNYSKQHAVQFLTEGQLQLPHIVPDETSADAFAVATLDGAGTTVAVDGDMVSPTEYWDATNLAAITRYAPFLTAASPVVGLGLDPGGGGTQFRIATPTDRTPFTVDTAGVLVRHRKTPDLVQKEGDWYLDAELGVLILHSDTWATGVAATATWTFSYSYYGALPALSAANHRLVHFEGPALPGRRVTYDSQSNWIAADEGVTPEVDILGRLLKVKRSPAPLLSSVKTAWNFANAGATFQMPGSATKGFPDWITLSEEVVSDQTVILNARI